MVLSPLLPMQLGVARIFNKLVKSEERRRGGGEEERRRGERREEERERERERGCSQMQTLL